MQLQKSHGALMSMVPVIIVLKDQEQAVEWSCVSFLSSWRSVLLHGAILQEFEEASAFVSRGRFVGEVLQRDNQSNFEIYLIIATRTENEWSK